MVVYLPPLCHSPGEIPPGGFFKLAGLKIASPLAKPKPWAKFWKSTNPGCICSSLPNMTDHPVWDNTSYWSEFIIGQVLVSLVKKDLLTNRQAARAVTQGWYLGWSNIKKLSSMLGCISSLAGGSTYLVNEQEESVNSCDQNSVHGPLLQRAVCALKEINGS